MAKKMIVKKDCAIGKGSLPDDVEELELECKEVYSCAFKNNQNLRRLKLINVKNIGKEAFGICQNLTEVELVNCGDMKDAAFYGSGQLTNAKLDCRIIGKHAFIYCRNLSSLELINTEVIGESSFANTSLDSPKLPGTLTVIKDGAFDKIRNCHLIIPPSVKTLGNDIVSMRDWPEDLPVLEFFVDKNFKAPFFNEKNPHSAHHTELVVRSAESGEILYRYESLDSIESFLTGHGMDFSEYDKMLLSMDTYQAYVEAARLRLADPVGMTGETFEKMKAFGSLGAAYMLMAMMMIAGSLHNIKIKKYEEFKYYYMMSVKDFFLPISYAAENNFNSIAKMLTDKLYKRLDDISESDAPMLAEAVELSLEKGMTEMTAALLNKLNEIGGCDPPEPECLNDE